MFDAIFRARRIAAMFGIGALLAFAATETAFAIDGIDAPHFAVGDRWRYQVTDNLRQREQSQLDVEVLDVSGGLARIRFQQAGPTGKKEWIDEIDGRGGLRRGSLYGEPSRPFDKPVELLSFPLAAGRRWNQQVDTLTISGVKGQILITGGVKGNEVTTVPAGPFDTVYIYRTVQFDDLEFWRSGTSRFDSIWYSGAAKAPVKERREGYYVETGSGTHARIRTESTLIELVFFTPGR